MKDNYNLGMYGAGHVARNIAAACNCISDRITKYAVASRTYEHALKFQKECFFEKTYKTYDELLSDNNVDIIYISTPTGCHYEDIKKSLSSGKNVICEKTICEIYEQVKELFELAKNSGLILLDATWTMYLPMYQMIDTLVNDKDNPIKWLFASFGYPGLNNKRLMNPAGGGSLLDKGIYCISVANRYLPGQPVDVKFRNKYKDGVDIDNKILLRYSDGIAYLHSSILHRTTYCFVMASKKKIILSRRFWSGSSFYIWDFPFKIQHILCPHKVNGYEYELEEMINLIDAGTLSSQMYSPEETLRNMSVIDIVKNR